jgi:hypothetical protein
VCRWEPSLVIGKPSSRCNPDTRHSPLAILAARATMTTSEVEGGGGGLWLIIHYTKHKARARAKPPPPPPRPVGPAHPALMGRAAHCVEADAVAGVRSHRSRRQPPMPLNGLRCGARLAHHLFEERGGPTWGPGPGLWATWQLAAAISALQGPYRRATSSAAPAH